METVCKNCGAALTENQHYCHHCGAKVITKRLTVRNLWHEISEKLLNVDSTIIKTFRDLFTKPEEVIDGFIYGVRRKYLNPVNYVAIAVTFSGLIYFLVRRFRPDFYSALNFQGQNEQAFSETMSGIMDFQGFIYFLSIPLMALISMIVFINIKKYNFTEQNVIYMFTGAQAAVLTSTFILIILPFYEVAPLWVNFGTYGIMIGYNAYVLKRLFSLSAKRLIVKTLIFLFVAGTFYIFLVVIFGLIFAAYMLITGEFPAGFEPPPNLKN